MGGKLHACAFSVKRDEKKKNITHYEKLLYSLLVLSWCDVEQEGEQVGAREELHSSCLPCPSLFIP